MPVDLVEPEKLLPVAGIRLATTASGVRYQGRDDILLMEISAKANTAAVFTSNAFSAAPVTIAKDNLQHASPEYLLVNAGNANAGTGQAGLDNARVCCDHVAEATSSESDRVLPFSTGVIGEQLPIEKITAVIPGLVSGLHEDNWLDAARAIMTTDTVAKGYSQQLVIRGETITITGITKGSGMICPNMATMLAFISTDVVMGEAEVSDSLKQAVSSSFNSITVDSDTSTNDACVLTATGESGIELESEDEKLAFQQALNEVCIWLAQAIVRDAEGATKFITVAVEKAANVDEARDIAYTIGHSPLVKTALYASDPNWGRILAAVGRAPVTELDIEKVDIYLGDVCVIRDGEPASEYTEAQGKTVLEQSEIHLGITLGRGASGATIWTSDLSHEYVSINADYRS